MRAGFRRILGSSASVRDKVSFSYAVRNVLAVFAESLAVEKNTSLDALNCPYVFSPPLALQTLHCTHTAAAMGFSVRRTTSGHQTAYPGSKSPFAWAPDESDTTAARIGARRTKVNVCLTLNRL